MGYLVNAERSSAAGKNFGNGGVHRFRGPGSRVIGMGPIGPKRAACLQHEFKVSAHSFPPSDWEESILRSAEFAAGERVTGAAGVTIRCAESTCSGCFNLRSTGTVSGRICRAS